MTDRASAEGLPGYWTLRQMRYHPDLRDKSADYIEGWDAATRALLALRDTGPRPDSADPPDTVRIGSQTYLAGYDGDTGPRPDSGIDHALHYDPSCEECAYLARPVMLPRPDSGIDERIALARAHLSAGEDVAALALLDAVLSTPRAALRDTGSRPPSDDGGPRPDSDPWPDLDGSEGPWRDDQGYWLGGMGTPDTGPRPDSGIEPHEHDHDCQSGNGKTHRHEYRHTHPVEHLHRHEHPTDEQVARRIALSTPRTETSE